MGVSGLAGSAHIGIIYRLDTPYIDRTWTDFEFLAPLHAA